MCGRVKLSTDVTELVRIFDFRDLPNFPARYNIAPTQEIAVVRSRGGKGGRSLALLRWGLVPYWAKDVKIGYSTFNARAEGIASKPVFRDAFRRRRCLVVVDGFYEWKKLEGGKVKQPYLFEIAGGRPFAFAGLWEQWRGPDGEVLSATIVTTTANALMSELHDRMPVILDPGDYDRWLDPEQPDAEALLRPCPEGWLTLRPVSRDLNDARNEGAGLVEPTNATGLRHS